MRNIIALRSIRYILLLAGRIWPPKAGSRKSDPATVEFEDLAKRILKGELKRRGITYAALADALKKIGVHETERNLNNKISRGGFSAAFLFQCMVAMGANEIRLI